MNKTKVRRPSKSSRRNAMLKAKHRKVRLRVTGELKKKANRHLGY